MQVAACDAHIPALEFCSARLIPFGFQEVSSSSHNGRRH